LPRPRAAPSLPFSRFCTHHQPSNPSRNPRNTAPLVPCFPSANDAATASNAEYAKDAEDGNGALPVNGDGNGRRHDVLGSLGVFGVLGAE
jgi:hypothetical protein